MTKSYKSIKHVTILTLAACSSLTLFGCKESEHEDPEEIEKELAAWTEEMEKMHNDVVDKFTKVVEDAHKNGEYKEGQFSQTIKNQCEAIQTDFLARNTANGRENAAMDNKFDVDFKDTEAYRAKQKPRNLRWNLSRTRVDAASMRCHGAAEGVNLPAVGSQNAFLHADAAQEAVAQAESSPGKREQNVKDQLYLEAERSYLANALVARKAYDDTIKLRGDFSKKVSFLIKCQETRKDQQDEHQKMSKLAHFKKAHELGHNKFSKLQQMLDKMYERCVHEANKASSTMEVEAKPHQHKHGRNNRGYSHHSIEALFEEAVDEKSIQEIAEHSRVSGENEVLDNILEAF